MHIFETLDLDLMMDLTTVPVVIDPKGKKITRGKIVSFRVLASR